MRRLRQASSRRSVLACLAVVLAVGGVAAGLRSASAASGPAGSRTFREALLAETNRVRRDWHLPPLALSEELSAPAQEHADDMLARDYFEHESPEREGPLERVERISPRAIVLGIRENLAKLEGETGVGPTARAHDVVDGWMRSKGHRRNLLSADSTHVGFGSAQSAGPGERVAYTVQVLGAVVGSWDETPPSRLRTPARWSGSFTLPVEVFLRDLTRPRQTYTVQGKPDVVWTGGLPLTVVADGSRVKVEFPRLDPGRYALMGRIPPESGYQELRRVEISR